MPRRKAAELAQLMACQIESGDQRVCVCVCVCVRTRTPHAHYTHTPHVRPRTSTRAVAGKHLLRLRCRTNAVSNAGRECCFLLLLGRAVLAPFHTGIYVWEGGHVVPCNKIKKRRHCGSRTGVHQAAHVSN